MNENKVLAAVKRNLCEVMADLDGEAISIEQSLADLGCNSIDRADIVTATMEDLSISVPVMEFQRVTDIRTLVELLRSHL